MPPLRRSATLLVALLLLLIAPALAAAHGDDSIDDPEQHAKEDLATRSVASLERHASAVAKEKGTRPGTRTGADTAGDAARRKDAQSASAKGGAGGKSGASARATGTTTTSAAPATTAPAVDAPDRIGSFGAVTPTPVVPVFTALLPNGKILMWDSVGDQAAETYPDQTTTRAAVYDPSDGTSKRVDVQGYNIFCSGFTQLPNGDVFVAGGNKDQQLDGIRQTHVFHWRTETWTRGPDMAGERWYPTVASLADGKQLIVGGGPTTPELLTRPNVVKPLTGITEVSDRTYFFLQGGSDGRAIETGTHTAIHQYGTFGVGSDTEPLQRDAVDRGYGSYARYDLGRTLVAGGGSLPDPAGGSTPVPTNTAQIVAETPGKVTSTPTGSMALRRYLHNLTVLADGTVLATGGNSKSTLVDLGAADYAAELWSPTTGQWTTMASAAVAREYHSVGLLLPDGRVYTGGGGICGACDSVGYLRKDGEIFTPPYLYAKDGSGKLATRPTITSAPATSDYGQSLQIQTPDASNIRKVALVKLGAPTHSIDQGQRYVPLSFQASSGTVTATSPLNPNDAPPGYYMLFVVDQNGVPSVSKMVRLAEADEPNPDLAVSATATGTGGCADSESPDKAVNGSYDAGGTDKWCSSAATKSLQIDLGASRQIGSVVVRNAGAGGEDTSLNTRDFRLQYSDDGSAWRTVSTVLSNTASTTTIIPPKQSARYLRILVDQGEQGTGQGTNNVARIYEVEAYATQSPRPQAAPVIAYSQTSGGGRAQPFQTGDFRADRANLDVVGNDAIRSLKVAAGYQVVACADEGGSGSNCRTYEAGDVATLTSDLDRRISELRITQAPANRPTPLVAFAGQSYAGASQTFEPGTYRADRGQLDAVGNDAIRSLKVAAGFRVTACTDEGGSVCATYQPGSVATLASPMDRSISQLTVTRISTDPTPPVTAYAGQSLTGNSQDFVVGDFRADQGGLDGVGNDVIRSIQVQPGYRVKACTDEGGGTCTTYEAGATNTLSAAMDRTISELVVSATS